MVLRTGTGPYAPLQSQQLHGRRRGAKTSHRGLLCWAIGLLVVGLVGFMQMSSFESRLHALVHRRRSKQDSSGDSSSSSSSSGSSEGQERESLRKGLTRSLREGAAPRSSSGQCIAKLEAAGVLADGSGQRLSAEQRQRRARERKPSLWHRKSKQQLEKEAAEDAAATITPVALMAQLARRQLYDGMESSLREKGLALAASSTQGMALGDMFKIEGGKLRPVVTVLDVAVRAIVMPLTDMQAAQALEASLSRHLDPLMPNNGVWKQHYKLYHSTIYHASTHLDPVRALPRDVDTEEYQILDVGHKACPLHLVLERVAVTPGGTVVACWQIVNGTDVVEIRRLLQQALPHASKKQVVTDGSILHTTLARLVAPPKLEALATANAAGGGGRQAVDHAAGDASKQEGKAGGKDGGKAGSTAGGTAAADAAAVLQAAADKMTAELCGLRTVIDKMWFVEEYEKLALALRGSFKERVIPLECEPIY